MPPADFDGEQETENPVIGLSPKDILLYPVPVHDELIINTRLDISAATIFNLTGQRVGQLNGWEEHFQTTNVSSLENGIYYIVFETEQGRLVKKFVKQ